MDVASYILDGLERYLELERELGVRTVPFDRALLSAFPSEKTLPEKPPQESGRTPSVSSVAFSYVFLHDRPLSPAAITMMSKIILALGKTPETAPIIIEKPVPKAKAYVILGRAALEKFQPTLRGAPGQWLVTPKGARVLITYSPDYILRFKEITPAVQKIKEDMWRSLKGLKHVE